MNLHETLAQLSSSDARRQQHDSEFFNPGQRGVLVISAVKTLQKGLKTSVILEGVIELSEASKEGAALQKAGTKVKKIYSLSKFDFHTNMMMNDLLDIGGFTGKEGKEELAKYFSAAMNQNALRGVICGFRTELNAVNKKTGQAREKPITEVFFSHISQLNDEADIAARIAKYSI